MQTNLGNKCTTQENLKRISQLGKYSYSNHHHLYHLAPVYRHDGGYDCERGAQDGTGRTCGTILCFCRSFAEDYGWGMMVWYYCNGNKTQRKGTVNLFAF